MEHRVRETSRGFAISYEDRDWSPVALINGSRVGRPNGETSDRRPAGLDIRVLRSTPLVTA